MQLGGVLILISGKYFQQIDHIGRMKIPLRLGHHQYLCQKTVQFYVFVPLGVEGNEKQQMVY